jgi:hypothetical protein
VSAALASGASVLLSEDLKEGRGIGGLTIRNPFSPLDRGTRHQPTGSPSIRSRLLRFLRFLRQERFWCVGEGTGSVSRGAAEGAEWDRRKKRKKTQKGEPLWVATGVHPRPGGPKDDSPRRQSWDPNALKNQPQRGDRTPASHEHRIRLRRPATPRNTIRIRGIHAADISRRGAEPRRERQAIGSVGTREPHRRWVTR